MINSSSLVTLVLRANGHVRVHKKAFQLLPNLEVIDLSRNSLSYLYPDTFTENPVLRSVDLSFNNFRMLEQKLLVWSSMSFVGLAGNPWRCDCNMARSFMPVLAASRSLK